MSVQGTILTTTPTSIKSSHSKARLLFNSDGSVKLLGDPSMFPGFGINGQSHTLVPTIGVDGNMTMLLAPTEGHGGKTFILHPTNGGTLPCPSSINPHASKPMQKGISLLKPIVPKQEPIVLCSDEMKHMPNTAQKSLLPCSKFVTHMRIDPTGSRTSTIQMPVNPATSLSSSSKTESNFTVSPSLLPQHGHTSSSMVLQRIAGKVNVDTHSVNAETLRISTPDVGVPDEKYRVLTVNYSDTQAKIVPSSATNNQWISIDNVISPCTERTKSVSNQAPVVDNNAETSALRYGVPCPPTVLGIKSMLPSPNVAHPLGAMIGIVSSAEQTSAPAAVPTMVFTHGFAADLNSSQSVYVNSSSKVFATGTVPSIGTSIVSSSISCLPSKNANGETSLPTRPDSSERKYGTKSIVYPSDIKDVCSKSNSFPSPSHNLMDRMTSSVRTCPVSVVSSVNATSNSAVTQEILDPSTGILAPANNTSEQEEDGVMRIRIDSVFSLAMNDESDHSSTYDKKSGITEDTKPKQSIDIEKVDCRKSTEAFTRETMKVTCPPCYVVLEQLSKSQIENNEQNMFKCSNYCRLRTLNFLCNLGLVKCEPIVHTMHPDIRSVHSHAFGEKTEPPSDGVDCDAASSQASTPPKSVIKPDIVTSHRARKLKPSCEKSSKVIRFVKVEDKVGDSRLPISVQSLISKSNRANSGSLTPSNSTSMHPVGRGSFRLLNDGTYPALEPNSTQTNCYTTTNQISLAQSTQSKTSTVGVHPKLTKCDNGVQQITSTIFKPGDMQGKCSMPTNVAFPSACTAKHPMIATSSAVNSVSPIFIKPFSGNPVPVPKIQGKDNKRYYLITLNGQRILVPITDANRNATTLRLGSTFSSSATSTSTTTPIISATSIGPTDSSACTPSRDRVEKTSKRAPDNSKDPVPTKSTKMDLSTSPSPKTDFSLLPGVRIKSEPKTRGYGDEKDATKATPGKKTSTVNVKREVVDSEWEEIWSSGPRPVNNPTDVCSSGIPHTKKRRVETNNWDIPTLTSSSEDVEPRESCADDSMPELPLMKIPSTADIAKKSAAQESRIEKLRATLKEKEMLIEKLKRERVGESNAIDDNT